MASMIETSRRSKEKKAELKAIVRRARLFLAPYFGISFDDPVSKFLINLTFPRVGISDYLHYRASSSWLSRGIFVPENCVYDGNSAIGHELGHWFHNIVNPELHNEIICLGRLDDFSELLTEVVADYSSVIYTLRKNPFQNPEFSLLELASMSYDDAVLHCERLIGNFYDDLWNKRTEITTREAALITV